MKQIISDQLDTRIFPTCNVIGRFFPKGPSFAERVPPRGQPVLWACIYCTEPPSMRTSHSIFSFHFLCSLFTSQYVISHASLSAEIERRRTEGASMNGNIGDLQHPPRNQAPHRVHAGHHRLHSQRLSDAVVLNHDKTNDTVLISTKHMNLWQTQRRITRKKMAS